MEVMEWYVRVDGTSIGIVGVVSSFACRLPGDIPIRSIQSSWVEPHGTLVTVTLLLLWLKSLLYVMHLADVKSARPQLLKRA